jgi:hypothetical protein
VILDGATGTPGTVVLSADQAIHVPAAVPAKGGLTKTSASQADSASSILVTRSTTSPGHGPGQSHEVRQEQVLDPDLTLKNQESAGRVAACAAAIKTVTNPRAGLLLLVHSCPQGGPPAMSASMTSAELTRLPAVQTVAPRPPRYWGSAGPMPTRLSGQGSGLRASSEWAGTSGFLLRGAGLDVMGPDAVSPRGSAGGGAMGFSRKRRGHRGKPSYTAYYNDAEAWGFESLRARSISAGR